MVKLEEGQRWQNADMVVLVIHCIEGDRVNYSIPGMRTMFPLYKTAGELTKQIVDSNLKLAQKS
jgi:hypothetical protein